MSNFHESTIAMSLYNIVAIGEARTVDEARAKMARRGMLVGADDLRKARDELLSRGRIVLDGEAIGVTGASGHIVASRDRAGDGWSGWQLAPFRPRPQGVARI